MGDRYVKSDEKRNITYIDSNNLYGHSMGRHLPYDENRFDRNVKLENTINISDGRDIGYFVEVDLSYPDQKQGKKFPIFLWRQKKMILIFLLHIRVNTYIPNTKLICDWTYKKKYLIHYRMFKFHVRHGMIFDKVNGIISIGQSEWLEKKIK